MLKLTGIKKSYGSIPVIDDIHLEVNDREIVGLVGPSGCGKTTALNIISGFIKDHTGIVENTFKKMSCVFQDERLLPWCSVRENIRIVNETLPAPELEHLLDIMGLGDFASCLPSELSGGMKQRTAIARAFAYGGDLLLMDEPFKSLDPGRRDSLMHGLVKLFTETPLSVLLVTHDHMEAAILCDRIVLLTERPARVIDIFENTGDKFKRLENKSLTDKMIYMIAERIKKQG